MKLVDGQISKSREAGLTVSVCKVKILKMNQTSDAKFQGVILVGGLGCSPYLYEHLKSRYQDAGINILQSSGHKPYVYTAGPWPVHLMLTVITSRRSAICRGAVYKGFLDGMEIPEPIARELPVQVTSTIARASYGMKYRIRFDESKHSEEDKVWSTDELEWKAKNQMKWFVRKVRGSPTNCNKLREVINANVLTQGENISKKEPVRSGYYQLHKIDFGDLLTVELRTCEDEQPPDRQTSSVKKLCDIENNLDVAFRSLSDWTNSEGKTFKKLEYDVEMVPSGATLDVSVYIDGRKQRSTDTAIRF